MFVFKQKTAYEMRISDWSLDVCSSDLFVTHDLEEAIALADQVYVLTAGPATVKTVFDIDLPRPRVMSEIRYDQRFIDIARTIWDSLREEVQIGHQRTMASGH